MIHVIVTWFQSKPVWQCASHQCEAYLICSFVTSCGTCAPNGIFYGNVVSQNPGCILHLSEAKFTLHTDITWLFSDMKTCLGYSRASHAVCSLGLALKILYVISMLNPRLVYSVRISRYQCLFKLQRKQQHLAKV